MQQNLRENIEKVIIGKSEVIDLVLTALIAGGHVLLEDMPGTGKTMLAKALARSLDMPFSRVQMTPDEQVQFLRKQGMSEEAIDEMKSLYEKARYSRELVTESEAERMRTIL